MEKRIQLSNESFYLSKSWSQKDKRPVGSIRSIIFQTKMIRNLIATSPKQFLPYQKIFL